MRLLGDNFPVNQEGGPLGPTGGEDSAKRYRSRVAATRCFSIVGQPTRKGERTMTANFAMLSLALLSMILLRLTSFKAHAESSARI